MLGLNGRVRVHVYAGACDMRRQIAGLSTFVQALEQGESRAQPMIDLYSALYRVERTATERNLDATGRRALRQAESVPLWRELERVIIDIAPA